MTPKFKKDLGFSYSVNSVRDVEISFDPKFENIKDYTSKDYISFAFKDSTKVLAKVSDPGKTLDGKTFKVYLKNLIKNSKEAGEKTGLEEDEKEEEEPTKEEPTKEEPVEDSPAELAGCNEVKEMRSKINVDQGQLVEYQLPKF